MSENESYVTWTQFIWIVGGITLISWVVGIFILTLHSQFPHGVSAHQSDVKKLELKLDKLHNKVHGHE